MNYTFNLFYPYKKNPVWKYFTKSQYVPYLNFMVS